MVDVIFSVMLAVASAFVAASSAVAWCENRQVYDLCVSLVWTGSACYWTVMVAEGLAAWHKRMSMDDREDEDD